MLSLDHLCQDVGHVNQNICRAREFFFEMNPRTTAAGTLENGTDARLDPLNVKKHDIMIVFGVFSWVEQ